MPELTQTNPNPRPLRPLPPTPSFNCVSPPRQNSERSAVGVLYSWRILEQILHAFLPSWPALLTTAPMFQYGQPRTNKRILTAPYIRTRVASRPFSKLSHFRRITGVNFLRVWCFLLSTITCTLQLSASDCNSAKVF